MESRTFFLDESGQLRCGWRLAFFAVAFLVCAKLLEAAVLVTSGLILKKSSIEVVSGTWGFVLSAAILFASATLVGWACGAWFEELSIVAVGWLLHVGWVYSVVV